MVDQNHETSLPGVIQQQTLFATEKSFSTQRKIISHIEKSVYKSQIMKAKQKSHMLE